MEPVFNAYVMVDWSAGAVPKTGADSIWIGLLERLEIGLGPIRLVNPKTRREAMTWLADLLSDLIARDRIVLVGFDFAFGYPAGFARRLRPNAPTWRGVWKEIAARVRDADDNANNRFEVAAALNETISGSAFPFWGCPNGEARFTLAATKPEGYGDNTLAEFRLTDRWAKGPQPVWKLACAGSVGGQTLLGIAALRRLRHHPWLAEAVRVWPFETGLGPLERPGPGGWRVLFAEIYPSMVRCLAEAGEVKDAAQMRAVAHHFARLDDEGNLAPLFAGPPELTPEQREVVETEEGWILGVDASAKIRERANRVPALTPTLSRSAGERGSTALDENGVRKAVALGPKTVVHDPAATKPFRYAYIRDPEEIYRQSFAIIRAEAPLAGLPADVEPLAVRLIHAGGDPKILADLAFTSSAVTAGRRALADGHPILVDAEMVASGIIRSHLPAANRVICTLREPGVAEAARAGDTTRSAAAVDRWRPHLEGAVVAIGNAPTALFRLLELIDEGAGRPALVLAFPVGFVGAAEAKEALIAHPAGVPHIALRGRCGGSAFAAAAVNALGGGDP